MDKKTIVCFGPGPLFKGGISNYNTSLAKALDRRNDTQVHIVSWTNQYPSIVPRDFVDKKSKKNLLENTNIKVEYITNYNNPLTWNQTVDYIVSLNPEKVIFQWAIAIQGLPLGFIARRLMKRCKAEIIFDLHFVIQKEHSAIDKLFTKYGINKCHTYIVHAYKTIEELKEVYPSKQLNITEDGIRTLNKNHQTAIKLYHPIYDLFQPNPTFDVARFKEEHKLKKHVFLFFGFIRKYKGLHNAIEAFNLLRKQRDDVSFIICGESFWNTLDSNKLSTKLKKAIFGLLKSLLLKKSDDEQNYNPLQLIEQHELKNDVLIKNEFVANEEVHRYFQASDVVVLFYSYATPSGVESLTYNFKMPLVATKVGHFTETIKDGFNGYLAQAEDIQDMCRVMNLSIEQPINRDNVATATQKMSWDNYATAIMQ